MGGEHIPRSRSSTRTASSNLPVHRRDWEPTIYISSNRIKCIPTQLLLSRIPKMPVSIPMPPNTRSNVSGLSFFYLSVGILYYPRYKSFIYYMFHKHGLVLFAGSHFHFLNNVFDEPKLLMLI